MVRTNRSAHALARGERTRVPMVSTPIEANTSSKVAVNLVSRSRWRNRNRRPASSRSEALGHLCDPWVVRVGGGSEDVHDPALHLGDDGPCRRGRSRWPQCPWPPRRGTGPWLGPLAGCRSESVAAQHGRDARLRHADAEFLQLADDAEISPPGVLPSQAADQLHKPSGKTGTTSNRMALRSMPTSTVPSLALDPRRRSCSVASCLSLFLILLSRLPHLVHRGLLRPADLALFSAPVTACE